MRFIYIIVCIYVVGYVHSQSCSQRYDYSTANTKENPLVGLVPYETWPAVEDRFPHSMEFLYFSMNNLMEGENGEFTNFNFEDIENFADRLAAKGKQAVFRVTVDYPDAPSYKPPAYLGETMIEYCEYGSCGLRPEYSDRLIDAMVHLIEEMGSRYDYDNRIGIIKVGFLGHWGEFHQQVGMPSAEKQIRILDAYERSFKNKAIQVSGDQQWQDSADWIHDKRIGFHDDVFTTSQTESYSVKGLENHGNLEKWKTVMFGGEVAPALQSTVFQDSKLPRWYSNCNLWRPSWLLNNYPWQYGMSETQQANGLEAIDTLGYKLYISELRLHKDGLDVYIENRGYTPPYYDFYVAVKVNGGDLQISQHNLKFLLFNDETDADGNVQYNRPGLGIQIVRFPNIAKTPTVHIDVSIVSEHILANQVIWLANAESTASGLQQSFEQSCFDSDPNVVVSSYVWVSENYEPCNCTADVPTKSRKVVCKDEYLDQVASDSNCQQNLRPHDVRECAVSECLGASWKYTDWSKCDCDKNKKARSASCWNQTSLEGLAISECDVDKKGSIESDCEDSECGIILNKQDAKSDSSTVTVIIGIGSGIIGLAGIAFGAVRFKNRKGTKKNPAISSPVAVKVPEHTFKRKLRKLSRDLTTALGINKKDECLDLMKDDEPGRHKGIELPPVKEQGNYGPQFDNQGHQEETYDQVDYHHDGEQNYPQNEEEQRQWEQQQYAQQQYEQQQLYEQQQQYEQRQYEQQQYEQYDEHQQQYGHAHE